MLRGCLLTIWLGLARFLVSLGYGSKGMRARAIANKKNNAAEALILLLSSVFIIGIFIMILLIAEGSIDPLPPLQSWLVSLSLVLGPVLLYILWAVCARKGVQDLILQYQEEIDAQEKLEAEMEELARTDGQSARTAEGSKIQNGWTCRSCGKINTHLDVMCSDCGEYR